MSDEFSMPETVPSSQILPPRSCTLGGVKVQFPGDLKPYKSQLTLMAKAVTGARKAQNCLLESPTGSGKTMAVLCSMLAWQQTLQAEAEALRNAARVQAQNESVAQCEQKLQNSPDIVEIKAQPINRMAFMDEWTDNSNLASTTSATTNPQKDALRKSNHSPDIFELDTDDDMEDFKPPKKKIQMVDSPQSSTVTAPEIHKIINLTKQKQAANVGTAKADETAPKPTSIRVPKIFFATRTHKQITQVVKEFKRTPYSDVSMTILSSREHTCIRELESGYTNKNEMCRALLDREGRGDGRNTAISSTGCLFKRGIDRIAKCSVSHIEEYLELYEPWDIEELVHAGKKKRVCPYFASRHLLSHAMIVFCPYNYLTDPFIRRSMNISLKGNVIIFDEAHNIEDSMRDAVSFSLEQNKLQQAILECHKFILRGEGSKYILLKNTFETLLDWMTELSQNLEQESTLSADRSCILTGTAYVAHMDNKGIGVASFQNYVDAVELAFEDTKENSHGGGVVDLEDENTAAEVKIHSMNKPSQELKNIAEGLGLVWNYLYGFDLKHAEDYRIVLTEATSRTFAEDSSPSGWYKSPKVSASVQLVLKFWCMNPAVSFVDFHEAHSIIVTSGTLSPMGSFQSELGVMFPHCLSTDHVIDPSQAWVATVGRGPNDREMVGTYRNAITLEYQDEVGDSILQICQAVPFGVLCFFPSYTALENIVRRWQETGKWGNLLRCKYVVQEPRRIKEFADSMHNFDLAVRKAEVLAAREGGIPQGEQTGALFLAVFRGKLSEGIDFKDNHARAVITVSIPFPSMTDLQVKLKKKYNDTHYLRTKHMMPGSQWYETQAYRAMNQALGRCVRHRNDWGAIILLDNRFAPGNKTTSNLSKWAIKQIQHFGTWSSMYTNLQHFMQHRIQLTQSSNISSAPIIID